MKSPMVSDDGHRDDRPDSWRRYVLREDSRCKVDAVEKIKQLDAELSVNALRDRDVLEDGHIDIGEARAVNLVATQVAAEDVRSRTGRRATVDSWQTECSRIDPLHAGKAGGLLEAVRDTGERIADDVVSGADFVEGLAAVECHQTIDWTSHA